MEQLKPIKIKKVRPNDYALTFTKWIGSTTSLIVHTIAFIISFLLVVAGFDLNKVLLVVTTIVSLEAIYLAIFIQMTVNINTQSLREVEEDIDEIQEDVDEIQEDIDEIQEDVDEIQEDDENDDKKDKETLMTLEKIEVGLQKLLEDFERLKHGK